MNLGEKLKIGPREEKGGGKLLKKVEFDFVSGLCCIKRSETVEKRVKITKRVRSKW